MPHKYQLYKKRTTYDLVAEVNEPSELLSKLCQLHPDERQWWIEKEINNNPSDIYITKDGSVYRSQYVNTD